MSENEDLAFLLGDEILNSDSEPDIACSSSSKRQRTRDPSTLFQSAVDAIARFRLPLPASLVVSVGTLQGTANGMDRLPSTAVLVKYLAPPDGNCYQYCLLSLLLHQIRGFLMIAPTVHTCGFKESKERGWKYSCNSLPCSQCKSSGDVLSSHLILLLLEFVEMMVNDPAISDSAHIVPRLSQITTQCRLAKLGPYTLNIPYELKCELASFILALKRPALLPMSAWPDTSHSFLLRPLLIQSKGSVNPHLGSSQQHGALKISSKLQKGSHFALLFYCESYTYYRNNEFCQNDINALTLILEHCFHYTVIAIMVHHSQEVFSKLSEILHEIQADKDVVFIYFSCHGSAEALLFTEAASEALETLPTSSYIELTDLLSFLMEFQIRNLTIFYDCCRNSSPDVAERGCSKFHPAPTLPGVFQIHPAAGFPAYESRLLGSTFTIKGAKYSYRGHGFFTWCLLKALCWLCSKSNLDTCPIQSSTLFTCLVYWQASLKGSHSFPGFDNITQVPLQQTSQGSVVYISNTPRAHWDEASFPILLQEFDDRIIYLGWLGNQFLWLLLIVSLFGPFLCNISMDFVFSPSCHPTLIRFLGISWLIVTIIFAYRAELIWLPIIDFRSRKPLLEELKFCRDALRKSRFRNYLLHHFSLIYTEIHTYGNQLQAQRLSLWASIKASVRFDLKIVQINQLDEAISSCETMLNSTSSFKYTNRDPLVVAVCGIICFYFLQF